MTGPTIRAFTAEDIPAAAGLLAERHRAHRRTSTLLSERFEDPAACEAEVAEAWKSDHASGSVAVEATAAGERVVGYLLGSRKGDNWGANVWVESAGHAAADPEIARDLYAHAAGTWFAEGRTAHFVVVPAHDQALVSAWFRLGFGAMHSHAVRPLPTGELPEHAGVTIRRARREDIPAVARLELVLPEHQKRSPVFAPGAVPDYDEVVADWSEDDWDSPEPEFTTFVAELDGVVVGSAIGCDLEKSSIHGALTRPDRAGFLGYAAVLPEARGRGVGRALAEAVLWWAADAGYSCVAIDWVAGNLLSSRTWPRLGFEETFVRLHRTIQP